MTSRLASSVLAAILLVYLLLGAAFASLTPAWQAPDEPAHYNYVRYVAETGNFPVLHMGDYPHAYMEQIKTAGFPPGMPIDTIRYEFHQPPLYYVLAAPVYSLAGGHLTAVRLFSVILGAGIVLLAYGIAQRIFPARPALALGTAAFAAFLPQHLATVSQVGNDVLAELLFAAVLYVLVGWVVAHPERRPQRVADVVEGAPRHPSTGDSGESTLRRSPAQDASAEEPRHSEPGMTKHPERRPQLAEAVVEGRPARDLSPWLLGLLLGLILITKTTAYIALPLAGVVLLWRWRRERATAAAIARDLLAVALPAALIALPWYARNVWAYGWPDILGLRRHDEIVVGQMRTEFFAQFGLAAYWRRTVEWTFKSFWGVFGWMGVWLDWPVLSAHPLAAERDRAGRVRAARAAVSGPAQHARRLEVRRRVAAVLLSVLLSCTRLCVVQPRLPAAPRPLPVHRAHPARAVASAWGWDATLPPRNAAAGGARGVCRSLAAWGILGRPTLPKAASALTVALGGALAVVSFLPSRPRGLAAAGVFALPPCWPRICTLLSIMGQLG